MLRYITENEYKELLGKSIPDNFNSLVIQASNYINHKTHGRIGNEIPEEVKYVTCLLIDTINEQDIKINEIGNLKSQNIEGWSETYATPEDIRTDYTQKMDNIISDYLWNVIGKDGKSLLYLGVC